MADINQLITTGIGTPSGVKWIMTFGLGIAQVVIPTVADPDYVLYRQFVSRKTGAMYADRVLDVPYRDRIDEVKK